MAVQSSTRKPWRKTRWAVFVIFLILLGTLVHHLPSRPKPRVAMRGDWLEFTALSSDGGTLVTSEGARNVLVWDTRSGRKVHSFPYRMRTVSADGRLLAMSDDTGTVIVADPQTGRRQTLGKPAPGQFVFSPTTKLLLVAGGEPEYENALFETDTGKLIGTVKGAGDDDRYQFTAQDKHVAWDDLILQR
jgi:WD40 repeat protein